MGGIIPWENFGHQEAITSNQKKSKWYVTDKAAMSIKSIIILNFYQVGDCKYLF